MRNECETLRGRRAALDRWQSVFSSDHWHFNLYDPAGAIDRSTAQPLLVGLTCSRLGDDLSRRKQVCDRIGHLMLDAAADRLVFAVAAGSAIHEWAMRAAELYRVPLLTLQRSEEFSRARRRRKLPRSERDTQLIRCCDRIEALYVRRGGAIESALLQRLSASSSHDDASVRVAVTEEPDCASSRLIADGAVGRWIPRSKVASTDSPSPAKVVDSDSSFEWIHEADEWLIHCTRACTGAWPGQTERQYADEWLLSNVSVRGPLETLRRIITMRRLVASAITSARTHPVVCFAGVALFELLRKRCYRPHLRRWDYEPFGIAVRRSVASRKGVVPVVYGDATTRSALPPDQKFRFQAAGETYDWTSENEQRAATDFDLSDVSADDLRVFVPDSDSRAKLAPVCPWPISVVDSTMLGETDDPRSH